MNLRDRSLLLVCALTLGACSPFSRKSEPKDLFPADSVSRALAQSIEREPLILDWRREGEENAFFSSLVFGPDTAIYVGDLGGHSVRRFTLDGVELPAIPGFTFPYLASRSLDTIAVYDAGSNRLVSEVDPGAELDLPPLEDEPVALARQVAVFDGLVYVKDAHPPAAVIHRLSPTGSNDSAIVLPGPSWHHYGVLRVWLGMVVSASSYRPILYLLDESGKVDSLRLTGFDSPMLARMRAFGFGQVDEPPLMISGVYGADDDLYVLNVRPGIVQIDVFDRDARLGRILQHESPEPTGFTPVDLLIHHDGDSTYAFVASVNAVYGPLSLQYASRLDRFSFARRAATD